MLMEYDLTFKHDNVGHLVKQAAQLFQRANAAGVRAVTDGGDPSLADMLIDSWRQAHMNPAQMRQMLHLLQEARDCAFEMIARQEAYGDLD